MIWIRTDGNPEIGSGHIMRCMSVAAEIKRLGKQVQFILADDAAVGLLESRDFEYRILHTSYQDMESELGVLIDMLETEAPESLLIDSYFVTAQYLSKLREYVPTSYIDDKASFPYPVDMLINYNIYGGLIPYKETAALPSMKFLLGCMYAPLREEFRDVSYTVRDSVEKVLLTTGGSDKYNLACQILRKVLSVKELQKKQYHVVSGMFNPYLEDLKALAKEHSNVHLHINEQHMSRLMQECDVAVTAGGSTMYELCAVGVPIICFSFVDNQEQIVETFAKENMVCYGGNYLLEKENMLDEIAENLTMLAGSKTVRERYHQKERELVDGQGACRIAQMILENRR